VSEDAGSRILSALAAFLRPRWISLSLVALPIGTLAHSLSKAGWVGGQTGYVGGLWLGAACGAALAASRFRGRTALAYSLALSAAAAGQIVGRVLPLAEALRALPLADVIAAMHVRLVTLLARAAGWGAAFVGGEPVNDTGLFVSFAALVGWNASAWLVWCVARRQRALEGLLPLGFLLALNLHLSGQRTTPLWLFVACAVLLAARANFTQQHALWERRRVDHPDALGWAWSGSALAIAVAITLLAGVSPIVGTPQGWQALSDFVRLTRLRTAETAEQLFSGVNPPESNSPPAIALTPNLNLIGAPLPKGRTTILWVLVSDPAPPPPEAHVTTQIVPRHYWRSTIFSAYTGSGWQPLDFPDFPQSPSFPAGPPPGRYLLRQHYEIVAPHGDALFAVNMPVQASDGVSFYFARDDDSARLAGALSDYDVTSWATDVTEAQLRAAPALYPTEIASTYLQLPAALPRRVRDLAARLTADAPTPYDRALRLQTYLRTAYPYHLDAPPPPPGRDAVDYFLFEASGGFCSYYASAMAVMLRAEGVPARVAAGYATGEYDFARGAYRVPADEAHAWVEVYFPGYGWVEFEPTPARGVFAYESGAASISETTPAAPRPLNSTAPRDIAVRVAALLGLLSAAVAVGRRLRAREPGWRTPRGQARALYRSIRRALARAGLVSPSSATPDEFLSAHAGAFAHRARLREAVAQATALYLRATFSPHAPTPAETKTARRLWQRAIPAWVMMWVKRASRG
jgi:transglutaminase-like putative cysteine protease